MKSLSRFEAEASGDNAPNLIDILIQVGGRSLGKRRNDPRKPCWAGQLSGAVRSGVGDRVAREAGLGIGLGHDGAAEKIDDCALAGAGSAHHRDVQRAGRCLIEKWSDAVADQGRRQTQLPRQRRLSRLTAAVLFQPAEVFSQLIGQGTGASVVHVAVR